ncbi:hypothetical protein ABZ840_07320 [Streptomyces sp. NPDC047117]|uniref:hypothetical protein n=1 Tax=Streptomyces sp. NPDC047117 TaxID=3155379 RepID=UPI003400E143
MTEASPQVRTAAARDSENPNLLKNGNLEQLPPVTPQPRSNLYYDRPVKRPGVDGSYLPEWDVYTRPGCDYGGKEILDVLQRLGPQNNDVAKFPEAFMREFPEWRKANFLEVNGDRVYGGISQEIATESGAEYEVSYWAGKSPWEGESKNWANGIVEVRDSYDKVIHSDSWGVNNSGTRDALNVFNPNWERHSFTFTARGDTTVVSFLEDGSHEPGLSHCDPGYHGGASYAGMVVRLAAPARQFQIAETRPASSSGSPITTPRDTPFGEFALRILDTGNRPLSGQQVTLELQPRGTGSYFLSGERPSETYKTSTDSQGWLTVPAGALQAGPKEGPMQVYAVINGKRLTGHADLQVGAGAAAFSVSAPPPWDLRSTPVGAVGYPGVRVRAEDAGQVARQRVSVSLPSTSNRGIEFVAERDNRYQLTVMSAGQGMAYYPGTLAGQTLTFEDVDLALAGKGSVSTLWVAVQVTGDASPGEVYLTFQVGDHEPVSTPVRVVTA